MKRLKVTVDGKVYNVTVEVLDDGAGLPTPASTATPLPVQVASPAAVSARTASKDAPGAIKSPLAGKVVSVDVRIGQQVDEGQQVATLEAMKMNTYIYAPAAGTIREVCVNPGDAVEEGAVLIIVA